MTKELEALERIGNKLATGGAVINQTFDFEIIKQALTELETLKSQNRNAYKEGYEQGKFDARMEENKILEIVKKHRLELEPHRHVSVCAPFCLKELDDIIIEIENEVKKDV